MPIPTFTRVCIGELDNSPEMNTLLNVADLNGDGRPDILSSGRSGLMAWFENHGTGQWTRHVIGQVTNQECGGLALDLDGDGHPDVINGGDWRSDELAWWRNPGRAGGPWTRHLIARTGATQFHDELVGDITNDGRQSLLFWNEGSGGLYWCPLPDDPTVSPWPGVQAIATGVREGTQPEEGLALADIDGDGHTEIVAGTYWYRYLGHGNEWERHKYCGDYITTVLAVGDVDGDGAPEIVVSEGDACIYGRPWGGRLAWFKPTADPKKRWEEHLIAEGLLDPHSLQLADLCGEGRLDVVVGEIGVADAYAEKPPKLMLFQNLGGGRFERHLIDEGTGTHHARLADFRGAGVLDIASRPLHGPDRGRIFVWYNDQGGSLGR